MAAVKYIRNAFQVFIHYKICVFWEEAQILESLLFF